MTGGCAPTKTGMVTAVTEAAVQAVVVLEAVARRGRHQTEDDTPKEAVS